MKRFCGVVILVLVIVCLCAATAALHPLSAQGASSQDLCWSTYLPLVVSPPVYDCECVPLETCCVIIQ